MSKGISTTYHGIQFRARGEALWAAFFDELRWPWHYEPIDLEGYIPDFILPFPKDPMLIEVKGSAYTTADLATHTTKIDQTSWPHEALIVGAYPLAPGWPTSFEFTLGLLRNHWADHHHQAGDEGWWDEATPHKCGKCDRPTFHANEGWYACRVCGAYDGDHYLNPSGDLFADAWAGATNRVQWQPRNGTTRPPPRLDTPRI